MRADFFRHHITKFRSERNGWIGIAALVTVSNLALSTALVLKHERTILVPPHVHKTLWVEGGEVSKEYLEEMGVYMAKLLLDISPSSYSYNHEVLLKYTTPESYGALKKQLLNDGEQYIKLQLSTHFKPTQVTANPKTLQVEVKGTLISYVGRKQVSSELETVILTFTHRSAGLLLESVTGGKQHVP